MVKIPGIWGIYAISTRTSFQQYQGCLGTQGFEGLLRFFPQQAPSNIGLMLAIPAI
jgi:hypothetical protein